MKFEKIKPGDVLYDVHSERAGNTTMRRQGIWKVQVISVDAEKRTAMVSWNGNPPRLYLARNLEKLRASEPKKLNGHLKGCPRRSGLNWGEKCNCKALATDEEETP